MYCVIFDEALSEEFEEQVKPLLQELDCHYLAFNDDFQAEQVTESRVITWVGDAAFYRLLPLAVDCQWRMGFLPHPEMNLFYRRFKLADKIETSLQDIIEVEQPQPVDMMLCNGQPVLSSVMAGDAYVMQPAAQADKHVLSKLYHLGVIAFNISQASLHKFQFITAKQVSVETAALGLTAVYRPSASEFTRFMVGETEQDEAMLHTVILAPRSMTQVLHYLFARVWLPSYKIKQLPDYAGYIQTPSLRIQSDRAMDFSVDGEWQQSESIEIEVKENALQLLSSLQPEKRQAEEAPKESIKSGYLPKGRVIQELCGRHLPWIFHRDQDEVKELFVNLKESSQASESFIVLMMLASVLATIGLFADSPPVIIGAMILAPMMSPILSMSMGILRQSSELLVDSARTLALGIGLTLGIGVLAAWLTPLGSLNHEISARLSPTLLDLGVAIFSGMAGAYASARSEVAKNLAGVAIAVALVPPLAVSAIGIGWWDWHVFWGAMLLFLTNLIGMVLAAALTFLVMGYSPFRLAKKGLLWLAPFVVVIAVPLVLAFQSMVNEQALIKQLEGWQHPHAFLKEVRIRSGEPVTVIAKLVSEKPLSPEQLKTVKVDLEKEVDRPLRLELVQAIVQE